MASCYGCPHYANNFHYYANYAQKVPLLCSRVHLDFKQIQSLSPILVDQATNIQISDEFQTRVLLISESRKLATYIWSAFIQYTL